MPAKAKTVPVDAICVDEFVAAESLGFSVAYLRKDRITHRRIPFFKIGNAVRYNLDRVRATLAAMEVGGSKPATRRASR